VWSQTSAGLFYANAIAVDKNFLYVVGGDYSLGIGKQQWRIEKRKLSDGTLERGFGSGGMVTLTLGIRSSWGTGVAIDSEYLFPYWI